MQTLFPARSARPEEKRTKPAAVPATVNAITAAAAKIGFYGLAAYFAAAAFPAHAVVIGLTCYYIAIGAATNCGRKIHRARSASPDAPRQRPKFRDTLGNIFQDIGLVATAAAGLNVAGALIPWLAPVVALLFFAGTMGIAAWYGMRDEALRRRDTIPLALPPGEKNEAFAAELSKIFRRYCVPSGAADVSAKIPANDPQALEVTIRLQRRGPKP